MFSVPLRCGNCSNLVDFVFWHVQDHTECTPEEVKALGAYDQGASRASLSSRPLHGVGVVSGSAHTHCPRCRHPALILYETSREAHQSIQDIAAAKKGDVFGGPSVVRVKTYYPAPQKPDESPFWPESLRQIFADCQDMLAEGKSPSIILATTRTVLELALKELGSDPDASLFHRIELLHQAGEITSAVRDWAHDIRLDGNAGTHNGVGERQAATEYVEFLKLFLDMSFSLPERIKQKRRDVAQKPG